LSEAASSEAALSETALGKAVLSETALSAQININLLLIEKSLISNYP
jgi:hypothetical protein